MWNRRNRTNEQVKQTQDSQIWRTGWLVPEGIRVGGGKWVREIKRYKLLDTKKYVTRI